MDVVNRISTTDDVTELSHLQRMFRSNCAPSNAGDVSKNACSVVIIRNLYSAATEALFVISGFGLSTFCVIYN